MVPEPTHPVAGSGGPAAVGVKLLEAPGGQSGDPQAKAYIVDHLAPGERIERRIDVSNPGGAPQRVRLYPAAATVDGDGFAVAPEQTGNELTSWVRVEPATLKLPPGQRATVTATIAAPERAGAGEHYGVVWAQVAAGSDRQQGVRHIGRAGIRIYLSVGNGDEPAADFEIGGLAARRDPAGVPIVSARVTNTGERALDLGGALSLSGGPGGLAAGPFPVRTATLGIGASRVVAVPLDAVVPEGSWEVRLTLSGGEVERTATGTVTLGPGPTATGSRWGGPIPVAALTTIGVGGLVWLLRRRRRRT